MREGHWAPLVGGPSGLRREVSSNDLFVKVRRHRAWSRFGVHGPANDGRDETRRKARRGSVFETRAARIDQNDAAVTTAGRVFDKPTERFEYCPTSNRRAPPSRANRFSPASSASARFRSSMSVSITHQRRTRPSPSLTGRPVYVKPAIGAVSTAYSVLDFVWFPVSDRALPCGNHRRKVIRMK